MAAMMTFASGVFALAIWVPSNSYGVLVFYALIGGAVIGTYWATIAPVAAEIIGLRDLPSALSLSWIVLVLPTTFSEPIALEIVQRTPAGYLGAQLFAGLMYIAAALCLVPVRAWKIQDMERLKNETALDEGIVSETKSQRRKSLWQALFTITKV
jgi:MFS family permease